MNIFRKKTKNDWLRTKSLNSSELGSFSSTTLKEKSNFGTKAFFLGALLFFLSGVILGIFTLHKIYSISKKISISGEPISFLKTVRSLAKDSSVSSLTGGESGRINILLLGIAGKGKAGTNLTDTIIILSLNTKTNRVALISIPRDFFAEIPENGLNMKINSIYQYGINSKKNEEDSIQPLLATVTNITSLPLHYYAILNFEGFQKIIDSLGGVQIMNERDIFDSRYPGPNYSYETFSLSKGSHQLDGATALKYSRVRHGDPEGDFGRAKRQQQVMQAAKNKIFSAETLLNIFTLNSLFNALGENIKTNIRGEEIKTFYELAKKLDTQNINNEVLDAWNKDSLLKVSHVSTPSGQSFVLLPRVGSYDEIQELSQNIFDLNEIRRKRDEIAKEDAKIIILNRSGDSALPGKIKKILSENLNYKNIDLKNVPVQTIEKKTLVYDLTNGAKLFTLDELVKKLPAVSSDNTPDFIKKIAASSNSNSSPLIISLGTDLKKIYNIEEGTLVDLESNRDNEEMLNQ
jgi:LCP family protein required for cell wall assembly